MSLSKKIKAIQQKPRHVRERMLIVSMAVITAVIFTAWIVNFHAERNSGPSLAKKVSTGITDFFSNNKLTK